MGRRAASREGGSRDSTLHAKRKRSTHARPRRAPGWTVIVALLGSAAVQPKGEDSFTLVATSTADDVRTAIDAGADVHARYVRR